MDISVVITKIGATIVPLIAIVSTGWMYSRRVNVNMDAANKANIDVFLPALIFSVMSDSSFHIMEYQHLALAACLIVLGSGIIMFPVCKLLGFAPKTALPPMMFNNSGNLGIPLMILAFGEQALPLAIILFIVENGLHFTVGLYILNHKTNPFSVLKMPMILATIAGIAVSAMNVKLPEVVTTPITMVGQISIPLMLFALGVRIRQGNLSDMKIGLWVALLTPLSGLIMAAIIHVTMPVPPQQAPYVWLFAVLPPAVLNFMIAERYQQEPHKVASIVLVGNIFALFTIPMVLFFIL